MNGREQTKPSEQHRPASVAINGKGAAVSAANHSRADVSTPTKTSNSREGSPTSSTSSSPASASSSPVDDEKLLLSINNRSPNEEDIFLDDNTTYLLSQKYKHIDPEKYVRLLTQAASEKSVDANCELGLLYLTGHPYVAKNEELFAMYMDNAADHGHDFAQALVYYRTALKHQPDIDDPDSICYDSPKYNIFSEADIARLSQQARQEDAYAYYALARFFKTGNRIIEQDIGKYVSNLSLAAMNGNIDAMYEYGKLNCQGAKFYSQQFLYGIRFIAIADSNGHRKAQAYMYRVALLRDYYPVLDEEFWMQPLPLNTAACNKAIVKIKKIKQLPVVKLTQLADEQNDSDAQYLLAMAYEHGSAELPPDPQKYVFRLTQAAMNGYHQAQYDLGILNYTGHPYVTQSAPLTEFWMEKSARAGNKDAQAFMFWFLMLAQRKLGLNPPMPMAKGKKYYPHAVETQRSVLSTLEKAKQDKVAAFILFHAASYHKTAHPCVKQDFNEYMSLLHRSAETGFTPAMYKYGKALFLGFFGDRKKKEGEDWIKLAATDEKYPHRKAQAFLYRFWGSVKTSTAAVPAALPQAPRIK